MIETIARFLKPKLRGAAGAVAVLIAVVCFAPIAGCQDQGNLASAVGKHVVAAHSESASSVDAPAVETPPYANSPSVEVNENVPFFSNDELDLSPLEEYSDLDALGRCGTAVALVGPETMPTERRESIGMVKPSGWRITEYDWIDGGYLFNRCHLIAYSLAGENDNQLNLITGTRSMNTQGMLPYEERVASYVDRTHNHVLYRVTPVFEGDNLVASGVLMEAQSIEDSGKGVRFCVWCHNVEPGVVIDYATGDSRAGDPATESFADASGDGASAAAAQGGGVVALKAESSEAASESQSASEPSQSEASDSPEAEVTYVLNTNTHRFHYPDCPSVKTIKDKNRQDFDGTREEAIAMNYKPCGVCKP